MKAFFLPLLFVLISSSVYAQQYQYKVLSPIISNEEEVIDVASSDWILVRDLTVSSLCPVAYNFQSKKAYRLCESGVTQAYAINRHGMVAGYSDDGTTREAVVWSPSQGAERLGYLDPLDVISEALSINDSGAVVGFSTKIYTINCNRADSIPQYTYPSAFVWRRKTGMEKVLSDNKGRLSVAVTINAHGDILSYTGTGTVEVAPGPCYFYNDDARWDIRTRAKVSKIQNSQYPYLNFRYRHDLLISAVGFQEHEIAFDNYLDILHRNTLLKANRRYRSAGDRFIPSRFDSSSLTQLLSPLGKVAGVGSVPFIEINPRQAVGINCLAPFNRKVEGSTVKTASLGQLSKLGGFDANENLYISGNISDDGRKSQIVLIQPLPRSAKRIYSDFCPELTASYDETASGKVKAILELESSIDTYRGAKVKLIAYSIADGGKLCPDTTVAEVIATPGRAEFTLPKFDARFTYIWEIEPKFSEFETDGFNHDTQGIVSEQTASISQCVEYPK